MEEKSLPQFITFTGFDDQTDIGEMVHLSGKYPIEWGVLFSPKRQGTGRYPSLDSVGRLIRAAPTWLAMSAHLCGRAARDIIQHGQSPHDKLIAAHFDRAQINTADRIVFSDPGRILAWGNKVDAVPILQVRDEFVEIHGIEILFDASGGRGIAPKAWPKPPRTVSKHAGAMLGYAGGLNPSNVAEAVAEIGLVSTYYWIDMESGVRDENDVFDLARCRAVCEAVYGAGFQEV
jgi:phosphoribosylanthranilate isomerase